VKSLETDMHLMYAQLKSLLPHDDPKVQLIDESKKIFSAYCLLSHLLILVNNQPLKSADRSRSNSRSKAPPLKRIKKFKEDDQYPLNVRQ
jgi:hypothetical protein